MAVERIRTQKGAAKQFFADVVLAFNGDDCLGWPFSRNNKGYGQLAVHRKTMLVHRLACEARSGPPPSQWHEAAHSCGGGSAGCCNPRHLYWSTRSGNEQDKIFHGTDNRGERHGQSKLTEQQVSEIRALRGALTQRQIAKNFGISQQTVSQIQRAERWSWLEQARA